MQKKYFNTQEFKDMLARYEDSLLSGESVYMDSDDLTDIAEYYHTNGRDHEAKQTADFALRLHPGALAPCLLQARMELVNGNPNEARRFLEQVDDSIDQEYDYVVAEILLSEGKIEEADQHLEEKFDTLDGEDAVDFVIDAAFIFADYNVVEKAEKWFLRSNEYDAEDYQELKGRILMGEGQYKEAEQIFNTLIDGDPYNVMYWNLLATVQFMQNHLDQSVESSEYAIAIDPNDAEAVFNKANGLFALTNYQEALKYCKRYAALRPSDAAGAMYQGSCLLSLGKTHEALSCYQDAIDKGWQEGYAYQALCYYELNDEQHFIDAVMKAIAVNPEEAAYVLSDIANRELKPEELQEWANRIIETNQYNQES